MKLNFGIIPVSITILTQGRGNYNLANVDSFEFIAILGHIEIK